MNVWMIAAAAMLLASLVQSLAGFGAALVAMSILISLLGLKVAAPVAALIGVSNQLILIARYRSSIDMGPVWRLILASSLAIPLGVYGIRLIDETLAQRIVGVIVVGYSLYALLQFRLPRLERPVWAFLAGGLGGLMAGAFNIPGPPVIIYGSCRAWPPEEFKGNLQAFFLSTSVVVIASHAVAGNLNWYVATIALAALPLSWLGLYLGTRLDGRIPQQTFRIMVLVLLLILGARLLF